VTDTNETRAIIEEAVEPDMPIIDPHHHLWDRPGSRYVLEELFRDIGRGHNIAQTVFVECHAGYRPSGPEEMKPVGETEFVRALADQSGEFGRTRAVAGIVGHADLTLGEKVVPVLEAHLEAGRGLFRGIRHSVAWNPHVPGYMNSPEGLLLSPAFQQGFACLKRYQLSFDAWLYHPQITDAVGLANRFPDTPIILDHVGGLLQVGPYAGRPGEIFDQWRNVMAELARRPNVFIKLGGLGMPNCGFGWNNRLTPPGSAELAEVMAPFYLYCIGQFGPARCMFESNFPVDRVSYSYTDMWNAFKLLVKGFSAGEKADLFHNTAARVYRLEQI